MIFFHPKLKSVLEIFRRAGVRLEPEEIIQLYEFRRACDEPEEKSFFPTEPIQFFGINFFPIHMLGEMWLQRTWKFFEGNPVMQVASYIYAHAFSAPGERHLETLQEKEKIVTVVSEWFHNLPLHDFHIPILCQKLRWLDGEKKEKFGIEKEWKEKTSEGIQPTIFLALMLREFPGTSLQFWIDGISISDAAELVLAKTKEKKWTNSAERTVAIENFLGYLKFLFQKYFLEHEVKKNEIL